jgi:hypothetical protein
MLRRLEQEIQRIMNQVSEDNPRVGAAVNYLKTYPRTSGVI